MKEDRLSTAQYKISGDPTLLDEINHITPEVRQILDELRPDIKKRRKDLDKKLNQLCLKYPKVPVFKNILSTFYAEQDNTKQAFAVNQWLVKEHPHYLFGKLNLAAELLENEEPEKIPEIMGEYMDIGQLYPERKEFHMEEVIGFYMIAVQYFLAVDKVEDAELRIEILEKLDEEHPKTYYAKQHLEAWYISHAAERMENENQMRKQAVWKDNRSHLQTTKAPQFHFAEQIGWLYENDLGISHNKVEQILQLDPEKLTEDLEKMLQDSIVRFEYFVEEVEKNGFENSKMDFPIHALLLLGELKSKRSLPSILQLLKQDDEFLEVWFGDSITLVIENALYHCGKDQTHLLFDFLKLPNIYHGSIAHVGSALVKIIERSEEKRENFIEEYRRVLKVLIENAEDKNFADTETTAFLINDLVALGYKELLPEIKQLFDLKIVGVYIYDSYEDVEIDIKMESFWDSTEFEDNTIYEKYGELSSLEKKGPFTSSENGLTDLHNKEMQKEPFYSDPFNKPYTNPNKAGRNDPCPCGSGKKYKKCCL